MRLDRFFTVNLVHPLTKRRSSRTKTYKAGALAQPVPILMYHSISDDKEKGVSAYFRTVTSPMRFSEQMTFLKENGWHGVSLREGLRLPGEARAESRPFIITFDDGFRDILTAAMPVLRQCNFGATVFLPTAFNSKDNLPRRFLGRDCLTWAEIRGLNSEGIELGSHTVSHPKLVSLPWKKVVAEIGDSKTEIENQLGKSISAFSYPYAFPQGNAPFCTRLRNLLQENGYRACVTTIIGRALATDDSFRLPRLPINDCDDLALLEAKMDGSYDWMAVPQLAFKNLRRIPESMRRSSRTVS